MERQQLMSPGIPATLGTQIRVLPMWGWTKIHFDECVPFLLRGRLDPALYAETIHGLNRILGTGVWRSLMWSFLLGSLVCTVLLVIDLVMWEMEMLWTLYGLIFFFMLLTMFCAIGFMLNRWKRVNRYLAEVNQTYHPLGLHFHFERHHRHGELVIDVLPQFNSSTAAAGGTATAGMYAGQQQQASAAPVVMQPTYLYPNPEGFTQPPQPQTGAFVPSPYNQAAYQQTYTYNGKTYEEV